MAQRQKTCLFLFLGLICFFVGGCKEVKFEKGELIGAGNLEFKVNELDRKTIYDGKRVQLVGYISPMWRQQGSDVILFLSEIPNSEDHKKQIINFRVREGAFPNRVQLGETGKTEKIVSNMVKDDNPIERVEFDPEKMVIYDDNKIPHKISEKNRRVRDCQIFKKCRHGQNRPIRVFTWRDDLRLVICRYSH